MSMFLKENCSKGDSSFELFCSGSGKKVCNDCCCFGRP